MSISKETCMFINRIIVYRKKMSSKSNSSEVDCQTGLYMRVVMYFSLYLLVAPITKTPSCVYVKKNKVMHVSAQKGISIILYPVFLILKCQERHGPKCCLCTLIDRAKRWPRMTWLGSERSVGCSCKKNIRMKLLRIFPPAPQSSS